MRSLFISAWYPNRYDAMIGLFVQKHAQAVSLYCDVKVLYVQADERINSYEITDQIVNGVNEIIIYYPVRPNWVFHKAIKVFRYLKAYWRGYKYLDAKKFYPEIIHANVLTRTGVIAYIYKQWKKTPYVVTEHWTRYLSKDLSYTGFFRKRLTEIVVRNAKAVMPVSKLLQQGMLNFNLKNENYEVVYNVVDDFFSEDRVEEKWKKKRILHISCFNESTKNVFGLLRATRALANRRNDFEMIIVGSGNDYESCVEYYNLLDFPDGVIKFVGEVSPREVSVWMQQSDFFVLFSIYETASVVIAESLVAGLPIVSTPTGIVPEVLDESNGIVVEFKDEDMLCGKLDYMLKNYQNFSRKTIRENAKDLFSFASIGKQIVAIYSKVLN